MILLPPFATLEDLAQRRPGGVGDHARAAAALDDASTLIRAETGKNWVDANDAAKLAADLPPIIQAVTCSVARRVIDNPDGIQTEALGSYSVTLANASGDVYLTKTERRLVRKAAGLSEIWTQPTTRDPDNLGTETASVLPYGPGGQVLVDVDPAGDAILWGGPDW